MPKISIIVPIYNVELYLKKCIDSILNQTFSDFEVILVNDGSTDNSPVICDFYRNLDSRVKVVHKKNGGLSDARNAGIEIAKGEYFSFIDGDDRIADDMLESLYTSMLKTKSDIGICNMVREFNNKLDLFYVPTKKSLVVADDKKFETLYQPSVCNKLFKRELFKNIFFPYGKYYEDTFIYHELLLRAKRIVFTGKNSYFYTSRSDSILGEIYNNRYFDSIEALYLRAKSLDEHKIHKYADESYLHIYSRLFNAYKNIEKETTETRELFEKSQKIYNSIFYRVIKDKHFNIKQKIRFVLLRYSPKLHCKIY